MAKSKDTNGTPEGFIANIDTANEEISRLTGELEVANTAKTELDGKLEAAVAAQEKLQGELDTVNTAKTELEGKLKTAEDAKKVAETAQAAEKTNAVKVIAAAGVTQPISTKSVGSGLEADRVDVTAGMTGLQRAIAANTALQAKS